MKILFLLLGTITLAVLANASPTADDAIIRDNFDGISSITKEQCIEICENLKPHYEPASMLDELRRTYDKLMEHCHCY